MGARHACLWVRERAAFLLLMLLRVPNMSSSKKGLLSLAIIALLGAGWYRMQSTQEPPAKPVKVALVTGGSGPFWQLVASGARDAAEKNDVTLKLALPKQDENVAEQTELLEKLSASKFDGIAISPLDAQGQTELLAKIAGEANMVTYDSDAPESPRLSYIGMNNARAGRLAAELVRDACPDGGKLAVIFANLTKDNLLERKRGFEEAMRELADDAPADAPKYEVVAQLVSEGSNEALRGSDEANAHRAPRPQVLRRDERAARAGDGGNFESRKSTWQDCDCRLR